MVDGIRLYRTPAAGNTAQLAQRWPDAATRFAFQRCDVSDVGIEVNPVYGDDQCEEFDSYGPMDHTPVDERDYSSAGESPPLKPDEY